MGSILCYNIPRKTKGGFPMASAFSFNDVTIFFSEKMLMNNVNLTISDGDRIGVDGKYGSGNSSFLRLLAR